MAGVSIPNGSAEAPIQVSSAPPVVGINFGNSYASIAVITKVPFFTIELVLILIILLISRMDWPSVSQTRTASGRSHAPSRFTERN
jgi:hypothetical protein